MLVTGLYTYPEHFPSTPSYIDHRICYSGNPLSPPVLCYHSGTSAFQGMPGDGDKQR